MSQNKHDLEIKIDKNQSFLNQLISTKRKTNELMETDLRNTNLQNNLNKAESQNPKVSNDE